MKISETASTTPAVQAELRRDLSLLDSTMINVGTMIGSGIFLVPATIALYLQSSWLVVLAWVIGGIVSLLGALSVAELGAMYPRAGGIFVYLREAYGPLWGFLYGWTSVAVINTASVSAVAVGFATYLGFFLALTPLDIKMVAIGSIVLLTAVNCFGLKSGARVQNSFTFLKIATIGAIALLALTKGNLANLTSIGHLPALSDMAGPIGLALVAVLWSYDGWIEITYVAGEVQDPQKNMPRSLILSTLLVILCYVIVNLAFFSILSVEEISKSALVAADAFTSTIGPAGAALAAIAVMIAAFGCNNGMVLSGARIYYAMASERVFFRSLARVHPRYHTPVLALIVQGVWASLLVLTGTFDQLFTYVIFSSWIFYAMAAGAVLVLRRTSPHVSRPYRAWGYPYTPVVFILFSLYLVINTLIQDPRDGIIGLGIILLGLPAYAYWSRKQSAADSAPKGT